MLNRKRLLLIVVVIAALASVYFSRVWEPLVYEVAYHKNFTLRYRVVMARHTWLQRFCDYSGVAFNIE